jgi:Uma2 family endonuclease
MLAFSQLLDEQLRPLRRVEYERLVHLGVFEGEKVELLFGRIVRMTPQGDDHSGAIDALLEILFPALLGRARVRVQEPFVAPDESEPEPDLAVVPLRDPFAGHPSEAFFIAEVASTSQEKDRGPKGALYAAAGVPEYWLVDVANRRVERYRTPLEGRYAEASIHGPGEALSLLAFPDVTVELRRVLPPDRTSR